MPGSSMTVFGIVTARRLLLGVLLVCGFAGSGSVVAQTANDGAVVAVKPVLGVLDVNHVMTRATAARSLAAQREGFVETYQGDVAETEKALRQQDQDLMRQRATLAPEEFAKRRQAFQEQVNAFQAQVQERRRKLEKAYGQAMSTLQATVIGATKDIAEQRGMNIVMYRSQTFLFDPNMDITDAVLVEVDKRMATITMQDPETIKDVPPEDGRER